LPPDPCYDEAADPAQALLGRILTAACKYWACKRGPAFSAEAMEVMGGKAYVEDGPLARLYCEFPVNSIWEGSDNVPCLDLARTLGKAQPQARAAMAAELELAAGRDPGLVAFTARLLEELPAQVAQEGTARRLAEHLVLAIRGALLLRHAPPCVSRAVVASRIAQPPGGAFGTLRASVDCAAILAGALRL
jgi:putative acyl-CoA dehydrogenase